MSLYGFKLENVTGVDLFSYSPRIKCMDMHKLEFPDADSARRWYHSPEYAHAKATRDGAATGSFILVEGV